MENTSILSTPRPKIPKLDPVEDFLINRKAGHCEYFASALALMLRAVNVPSRLVSGFKGGTVNAISGAYEVEQRHAHVWVEALLGGDRWLTVDPTPPAREVSVASFAAPVKSVHELASVVNSTWSQLMNMSINDQQTSFYVPIRDAIQNWWTPRSGARPFLAKLYYGVIDFATDPTQWFTVKGILAASVTGALFTALTLLVRMRSRIWKRIIGLWKRQSSAREIRIAFYERFEALCRQLGLVPSGHQTQREFAGSVGARIREVVVSSDGLPDLPPRLVDFFYRVRFGDEDLSPAVVEQLNRDLTSLEGALRDPRRRGSGDRPNGPRRRACSNPSSGPASTRTICSTVHRPRIGFGCRARESATSPGRWATLPSLSMAWLSSAFAARGPTMKGCCRPPFGRSSVAVPRRSATPRPIRRWRKFVTCWRPCIDRCSRSFQTLDDALLDQPTSRPHPRFSTKGGSLAWCAEHEMIHAGQIGLLRRLHGQPPLW